VGIDYRKEKHMTEHREALDITDTRIIETFGNMSDPIEREKLLGTIDLGHEIAAWLHREFADEGTWVDTGSNGESYDCHVTIKGREFSVNVRAGSTDAEDDAADAEEKIMASQWDLLCPRVIEALGRADPELAAEFKAYVSPKDDKAL
jgi:hypothetical protein